jgi:hypothetical protein
VCAAVDAVLEKTGTRRMIMGHTPDDKIISRCGGKVLIIDTGKFPLSTSGSKLTPADL